VWGNLSLSASFSLAEDAIYVNAPSPMIVPGEKHLLALLNSKVADFYIRSLGVTRSGGYFEYKPMFVQEFPALNVCNTIRGKLENLVALIMSDGNVTANERLENEINAIFYELYGLSVDEVIFLEGKL
jgi:hypothetical protein